MATSFDMNRPVRIFGKNEHPVLDLLGPTVQFFTTPDEAGEEFCVLKSTLPPGAFVPIHSHADVECFYMLSGQQEILIEEDGRFRWTVCRSGDFVDLPSSVKHAFRNRSFEPAVSLISTTAKLGHFFEEVGRPVLPETALGLPTPETLQHFVEVSTRYGYWLATPEENATAGLHFSRSQP